MVKAVIWLIGGCLHAGASALSRHDGRHRKKKMKLAALPPTSSH